MWDEDRIHRWLAGRPRPPGLTGSQGHDAAVLSTFEGNPVTCVDQTVEGVHYTAGTFAQHVGVKAAGRALSDLAATAARPIGLTLAVSAPREADEEWLRGAIDAADAYGAAFGAALVGGDLCCAPGPTHLVVSALGSFESDATPPGRDRAKPGQLVIVTGPVGGSLLGRHLAPRPRTAEGRWLFESGATAMMDVSDGLAWDLFRIARASSVRIELEDVPVHPDAEVRARTTTHTPTWHALHDGEDHELLATVHVPVLERILAEAPTHCPDLRVIGRVSSGEGLYVEGGAWTGAGGYRHGT